MKLLEDKRYSVEEYFVLVEASEQKLEYHRGRIYAMSGGTSNHSIICSNVNRRISEHLDDRDCVVYTSDMGLELEKGGLYLYPDAMVVCGEKKFSSSKRLRVCNPILIVEVLSKSTAQFDKTDKFRLYRNLPSLKEYLLIYSDRLTVETFYKEAKDLWRISTAFKMEDIIHLYSLNIDIPVHQIYTKTDNLKDPF